jgi:hypothetical protein
MHAGDAVQPQVVYVQASESNPNTSEIDELCRKMAEQGLALAHVSPSQGEGGVTVGLWLFFSSLNQTTIATGAVQSEAWPGTPALLAIRQPNTIANLDQPPQTPAFWWHEVRAKKGLGLSLTLTGVMALIIGSMLHFALRNNLIDTTLHLGYFFGLVGLLLFLIGLVVLF